MDELGFFILAKKIATHRNNYIKPRKIVRCGDWIRSVRMPKDDKRKGSEWFLVKKGCPQMQWHFRKQN
jgi:hypothetical protein